MATGEFQTVLIEKGYDNEVLNDIFNIEQFCTVQAFQSQNLYQHGQPLVIDGNVGEPTSFNTVYYPSGPFAERYLR